MTNGSALQPGGPADAESLRPQGVAGPGDTGELQGQPGGQGGQLEGPPSGPLGQEPPGLRLDPRTQTLEGRSAGRIRRVALALGGGGARGAFQVGVLKNLFDRGFNPTIVTGTSVGALNAAKVAEGRGREGIEGLERLWRTLEGNDSIYVDNPLVDAFADDALEMWKGWALAGLAWTFLNAQPWITAAEFPEPELNLDTTLGEIKTAVDAIESQKLQDPLIDLVESNIDLQLVADSGIRLRLAVVARDGGELRFFTERGDVETAGGLVVREGRRGRRNDPDDPVVNRGDTLLAPNLADGVIASSAIPLIFKPWLVQGGEYYWDGAAREGVSIQKALDLGATDMVVVLTSAGPWAKRPKFSPSQYALVIERVRQIDNPEGVFGRRGDFFVSVQWGHNPSQRSQTQEGDVDFSPHWTFSGVWGDINIRVYDDEGRPDLCDVCPEHGRKELRISLDGEAGTISGDVSGRVGDLIHARGAGDGNRVEIWFRIVGYEVGSSYSSALPSLIQVTPVIRMLQLLGQMQGEAIIGDFTALDTLDVLHEMAADLGEGTVVRSLNGQTSFPLPRDLRGKAYALPRYVVIEAPISFGSITEFDPEYIKLNIAIGELVAKYTRVGFLDALEAPLHGGQYVNPTQDPSMSTGDLEQLAKHEILTFLNGEVERWRELAEARGRNWLLAERMRQVIERKLEWYRNVHLVPTRRSVSQTLALP